jgi:transposase
VTIGKINILKAIEDAEAVLKNNPELSGDVKALMNLLLLVIKLLVDKMGLNSENSSIPPSKDPLRNKGRREKSGKKPGGQEGHVGATLGKEANPDIIKVNPVDQSKLRPGNYKALRKNLLTELFSTNFLI